MACLWPCAPSLSCFQILAPLLNNCDYLFWFGLLICFGTLFVIGLAFAFPALLLLLDFCACLRMANLHNVPKLKCIAGWVLSLIHI